MIDLDNTGRVLEYTNVIKNIWMSTFCSKSQKTNISGLLISLSCARDSSLNVILHVESRLSPINEEKSWWKTNKAHPHYAGCLRSRCGNCGTCPSILVESWEVRREKEGRGMAVRPEARGWWWEVVVPKCPAQSLHRWIPRLNWVTPYLDEKKLILERYSAGSKHRSCFRRGRTLAEVPKSVVALFREGDFVDSVSQVTMFQ